jgi:hypothetical protein
MLETSYGLSLFLKPSCKEPNIRYLYSRITVDGIRKETSTKRIPDYRTKIWNARIIKQ